MQETCACTWGYSEQRQSEEMCSSMFRCGLKYSNMISFGLPIQSSPQLLLMRCSGTTRRMRNVAVASAAAVAATSSAESAPTHEYFEAK